MAYDLSAATGFDRIYAPERKKSAQLFTGDARTALGPACREAEIRSESAMSVLVVMEHRGGTWNRMSFETIAAGQQIAKAINVPLEAAVLSANASILSSDLAKYGVSKVYSVSHPLLERYTADAYASATEQLARSVHPKLILFPHTYQVRDFAPKVAARFGKPLIGDAIAAHAARVEASRLCGSFFKAS